MDNAIFLLLLICWLAGVFAIRALYVQGEITQDKIQKLTEMVEKLQIKEEKK